MTKDRRVRAAAVQLSPVLFSREGTTEKICDRILEASRQGAELVVFPETVVPYYPYFSFIKPPVAQGPEHLKLVEEDLKRFLVRLLEAYLARDDYLVHQFGNTVLLKPFPHRARRIAQNPDFQSLLS